MGKKLDVAAAVLIGAVLISLMPWSRMLSAKNDFVHFYIGGALFGTPQIFSPAANYALQRHLIGGTMDHSFFGRPAFYGLLLKPLSALPYKTAYWIFQAGSLLSFCIFFRLNARYFNVGHLPNLTSICAMSPPLFANFFNGQDVCYVLLACSASVACMERGWEFAGGMLLSLCAIKAHLFVLVPVAAVLWKRWRLLMGGALGGTTLILMSLPGAGWKLQLQVLKQLGNPEYSPYPDLMPSVRSLTGDHHQLFLVASVVIFAAAAYLMSRSRSFEGAFGWALIGGLLASFHAYMQDCLLLLLALRLLQDELSKSARIVLYIAVLPVLYVALLAGSPYSGVFPFTLMLCLGLQIYSTFKLRAPALAVVES